MTPWVIIGSIALLGGIFGHQDYLSEQENKRTELDRQAALERQELEKKKQDLEEVYNQNKETLQSDFDTAKGEAEKSADRQDLETTMGEGFLSSEYGGLLAQLGIQQAAQNAENAGVSIGNRMGAGAGNAALATSGVRAGSSVAGALERQTAYADNQAALSRTAQDKALKIQQDNLMRSLAQGTFSLGTARYQSNELRKSYNEGGSNWTTFQNLLDRNQASYNQQLNAYNRAIANTYGTGATDENGNKLDEYTDALTGETVTLGTTQYQTTLDGINENEGWNGFAAFLKGMVGGAKIAASFF